MQFVYSHAIEIYKKIIIRPKEIKTKTKLFAENVMVDSLSSLSHPYKNTTLLPQLPQNEQLSQMLLFSIPPIHTYTSVIKTTTTTTTTTTTMTLYNNNLYNKIKIEVTFKHYSKNSHYQ